MSCALTSTYPELSPKQQQLLTYLSAFQSAFTEAGIQALYDNAGLGDPHELLQNLVESALIERTGGSSENTEYAIPASVRTFAAQQLVPNAEVNDESDQTDYSYRILPSPGFEGLDGFGALRTIMAASSLGILQALNEKPDDGHGLAQRLSLHEPAVILLLQVLDSMDYIYRDDRGQFRISPARRRWLLPKTDYTTADLNAGIYDQRWKRWSLLEHIVRTGEATDQHSTPSGSGFWESYVRTLYEYSREVAPELIKEIAIAPPTALLDVAGGPAGFAIGFCEHYPELTATIVDLEASANLGKRFAAETGYDGRIKWIIGDFFEVDFGTNYDLALAGAILNFLSPQQCERLLTKIHDALRPDATVVSFELILPRGTERTGTTSAVSALLFMLGTAQLAYSPNEIATFLKAAGFDRIKHHSPVSGRMVLTARVPSTAL